MASKSVSKPFRKYPDIVTIAQVCEMLGISRNYAYALVNGVSSHGSISDAS